MKAPFIDVHTHIGVDLLFYEEGGFPYAQHFRSLVEEAKMHGIERLVTFPFVSYFGWEGLKMSPGPIEGADLTVPYAYENLRMLREIYGLNADLAHVAIPFVIVDPSRHQQKQADSLRALKKEFPQIRGLKIQATIIRSPITDLLTEGRCLLELAQEWDVPVLIHSSIAPADVWSQCSDILDIVEAWPGVRFCLAHSCRFDQPSLERIGQLPNAWFDVSAHCIHCDAAVDERAIVAVPERRLKADYTKPELVMKAMADLLPDRMMWGSDAPFYSYAASHGGVTLRLISSYQREIAALSALSPGQKQAVLHDNIIKFLGVPHV